MQAMTFWTPCSGVDARQLSSETSCERINLSVVTELMMSGSWTGRVADEETIGA